MVIEGVTCFRVSGDQVTPQTTNLGQQAQTTHYESALGGSSGHNEFISQVPTVGWV